MAAEALHPHVGETTTVAGIITLAMVSERFDLLPPQRCIRNHSDRRAPGPNIPPSSSLTSACYLGSIECRSISSPRPICCFDIRPEPGQTCPSEPPANIISPDNSLQETNKQI